MTERAKHTEDLETKPAPRARRERRRLSVWKKLLFTIFPFLLLGVGVEIYLRWRNFEYKPDRADSLVLSWESSVWTANTEEDSDVLYRFAPQEAQNLEPDAKGLLPLLALRINGLGYRGDNFSPKKQDAQRPRILCYGDSVTFGVFLRDEDTIPVLMAKYLAEDGTDAEVLNLALPSYTSTQSTWDFEARGIDYEPDVVVMHLACWNDFAISGNNRTDKEVRRLRRLRNSIYEPLMGFKLGQLIVKITDHRANKQINDAHDAIRQEDRSIGFKHRYETRRVSLPEFQENVDRILELARARDISVLFVVPAEPTTTQEEHGDIYQRYHDIMRAVSTSDRVGVVELQPSVDAGGGDALFVDFTHYTAAGCKVVAKALVEPVERLLEARSR